MKPWFKIFVARGKIVQDKEQQIAVKFNNLTKYNKNLEKLLTCNFIETFDAGSWSISQKKYFN